MKTFEDNIDTMKMMRKIRDSHYEIINKKTKKDIIGFFKKKALKLKKTNI